MNSTVLQELVDKGNTERAAKNAAEIVYIVIVAIIGIVGNIAAILFYSLKGKKTTSTILMILLSVNDLCVSIIEFASIAFPLHSLNFPHIEILQMYFFTAQALNLSSLLFILIITVDRYRLVCLMKQFSKTSLAIIVTGVYMYSFITASRYFFVIDEIPVNITLNNVSFVAVESGILSNKYPLLYWSTFVMDSLTFIMVITVSAVLYWRLFKKLQNLANKLKVKYDKSTQSMSTVNTLQVPIEKLTSPNLSIDKTPTQSDGNTMELNTSKPDWCTDDLPTMEVDNKVKGNPTNTSKNRTIQLMITKMMFCITVASVVSYFPCYIIAITTKAGESYEVPVWQKVLYRSYMLNTSINPYIIGYFNKDFRLFLIRKVFRCVPGSTNYYGYL